MVKKQVASLHLCKKLRELGVRQSSVFWWMNEDTQSPNVHFDPCLNADVATSAFTAVELFEMLPSCLECDHGWNNYLEVCKNTSYEVEYENVALLSDPTLPDALARMLINITIRGLSQCNG